MSISEKRFITLWELSAGADAAKHHCIYETNQMKGFALGLEAAVKILNAASEAEANQIAAQYRSRMANVTGTIQGNWKVGSLVPDKNWHINKEGGLKL